MQTAGIHHITAIASDPVSPVMDRQYFRSIYFREPNGILFEIATDGPGFGIDESIETLGQGLKLPPAYERMRAEIKRVLLPPCGEIAIGLRARPWHSKN